MNTQEIKVNVIKEGLDQLEDVQLRRIKRHVKEGRRLLLNGDIVNKQGLC